LLPTFLYLLFFRRSVAVIAAGGSSGIPGGGWAEPLAGVGKVDEAPARRGWRLGDVSRGSPVAQCSIEDEGKGCVGRSRSRPSGLMTVRVDCAMRKGGRRARWTGTQEQHPSAQPRRITSSYN